MGFLKSIGDGLKSILGYGMLLALLVGAIIFGVVNCKRKEEAETHVASLQRDSTVIETKYLTEKSKRLECERDQSKTRESLQRRVAGIEAGELKVSQAVAKRNPEQQRVSVVKGLVRSKALPAERLSDSTARVVNAGGDVLVDTGLVAAVDRITGWYQVYKDSTEALVESAVAKDTQIETLLEQNRDCQDEVATLRQIADRPRRGKFWTFVIRLFGGKA